MVLHGVSTIQNTRNNFSPVLLVYKGEVSPNISLGQHITKIQGLVKSVNSWSEINNINSDGLDRTSSPGYIIKNNHQHCTKITDDGLKWLETCLIVLN